MIAIKCDDCQRPATHFHLSKYVFAACDVHYCDYGMMKISYEEAVATVSERILLGTAERHEAKLIEVDP